VVELLLERGAPVSAKTRNGLTALHMAAQGDHVDTAKILLFHKAIIDDVTVVCSRSVCMQLNNIQPVIMKRPCVAVNRFPSHSYGVLHAIWDNTVKGKGKGQYSSSWGISTSE